MSHRRRRRGHPTDESYGISERHRRPCIVLRLPSLSDPSAELRYVERTFSYGASRTRAQALAAAKNQRQELMSDVGVQRALIRLYGDPGDKQAICRPGGLRGKGALPAIRGAWISAESRGAAARSARVVVRLATARGARAAARSWSIGKYSVEGAVRQAASHAGQVLGREYSDAEVDQAIKQAKAYLASLERKQ